MKKFSLLLTLFVVLVLAGCSSNYTPAEYSGKFSNSLIGCINSSNEPTLSGNPTRVIVAGHAYGVHGGDYLGLYPIFKETLNEKEQTNSDKIIFFTGDVVEHGTVEEFLSVKRDLSDWQITVAQGNHDLYAVTGDEEYFPIESVFKQELDGARVIDDVRFVYLDTATTNWIFTDEQIGLIKNQISLAEESSQSVILLTHNLVWADIGGPYNGAQWGEDFQLYDPISFRNLLSHQSEDTGVSITVISGDVGAFEWTPGLYCQNYGGVKYIGSGMGGGIEDNYLRLLISGKEVFFEVVEF